MKAVNEFTCEECGGIFPKDWTDKEALAEAQGVSPGMPLSLMAVVCDDCYKKLMQPDEER